jgi:hypothetical protein
MRKAHRPYVMAGVALVGATALALTPVIATPPDIKIVNPQVRHTVSPFDAYRDAVEHILANLGALLGSALARQAPNGLNFEYALDSVFGDPADNFEMLRDSLEGNVDDLPVMLENMRSKAFDALEAVLADLAAGRIDLAVGQLLSASLYVVVQAINLVTIPVRPLLGDLGEPVTQLGSDLTVALLGPVVNGVGTTAEAIQGLAAALESGEPDRVLNALVTAPALITDRVLNGGYVIVPNSVLGSQAWPGVLTDGVSGPVSAVIEIGQFLRLVATPQSDMSTTVPLRAMPERVVTLDVDAGTRAPVVEEKHRVEEPKDTQNLDEGNNKDVMTTDDAVQGSDHDGRPSGPFGSNSTGRSGGGAALKTVRNGIRDGIEGLREGVRNVVKTVTGRGDDHVDSSTGSAEESP